jgi:hypothetical protein
VDFSPSSPSRPAGNLARVSRIAFVAAILPLSACVLAIRKLAGRTEQSEHPEQFESEDVSSEGGHAPAPRAIAVTPPASGIARRLQLLETLRASGAISDVEYAAQREQIIADI